MATVTKTRTYDTTDTLTAAYYNADRDEIITGVNSIANTQVASDAAIVYSKLNLTGGILNADINASAAIALSKLATGALPTGITIASANIVDDSIVNADINSAAAIAYSKLALTNSILNADINSAAAIVESKLAFNTSTGHNHDGSNSKLITINRAFTWYIDGTAIVANEVGAKYIAPQNMTVSKIWYKLTSGTCTIRIQKGTTDIDAGNSVTSTLGSTTSITSASITAGDIITLDITAASSPVGLIVCMECTA